MLRFSQAIRAYPELAAVVVAGVIGLTLARPFRWMVSHHGINVLLVVLVFATAVTITIADLRSVAAVRFRLVISLLVGATVLPALSWGIAHIVATGPLRLGVLTIGLAPCEIASVATTAMAGGQAASSAVMLIGSTLLSVALAGPLLALEAGHSSVSATSLIVNLTLIVVVPLVVGIAIGARTTIGVEHRAAASNTATVAVAALVALIASQIHLSASYLGVLAATLAFLAASALVGWLLAVRASPAIGISMLLTTSMRDFAIAAGIARTAFGAAAAAPLGIYGIVVLVWGTTIAGLLRRRMTGRPTTA